jgi:uncharacterized membrane protein
MYGLEFLVILALGVIVAPYVLVIYALSRVGGVERQAALARTRLEDLQEASFTQGEQIAVLRREIQGLRRGAAAEAGADLEAAPETAAPSEAVADGLADADYTVSDEADADTAGAPGIVPPVSPPPPSQSMAARLGERMRSGGLERQFGAVLPVWIGGIALAFAGFFLVKYSIENQLIGPELRVILGGLLGAGLIVAAHWVGGRSTVESAGRIAQSLAGAGIAVLYVVAYAATALYDLLPPLIGFIAMAGVTGFAVILSLRHGPPIALMGLLGGFLTPALIRSDDPSAMMLFAYLFVVFAAIMVLIRRRGWWLLALPALFLAFLWVIVWMLSDAFRPDETVWAGLFIIGVAGTLVAATRERYSAELAEAGSWRALISFKHPAFFMNTAALAGAFALMAVLAFNSQFGLADWVLFGILATGAVALAYFNTPLYGFAPWAAAAVNLLMLAGWEPATTREMLTAIIAFGSLYVLSGLLLFRIAAYPLLWAGLAATSAIGYYLLAYFYTIEESMRARAISARSSIVNGPPSAGEPPALAAPPQVDAPPSMQPVEPLVEGAREAASAIPYVWGFAAMGLALLFFGAALQAARTMMPSPVKDRVLAAFALATAAFVALGLSVELEREFLSVAIAAELLAVTWVAGRTGIAALRPIAALLGLVFAFLLFPQIMLLLQLAVYSLFDIWPGYDQGAIPLVEYPHFQLALPAGFFLGAAWLLRKERDDRFVRILEGSAVALVALWGFYVTSSLFHPGENVLSAESTFLERGLITNVLFLYGLGCLAAARYFARPVFAWSGALLVGIALFRIAYFDLLLKNPAWYHIEVPGGFLFNALAVTYLLPIAWSWFALREMALASHPWVLRLTRWMPAPMLVFAFAWMSLEIRRTYQGPFLDGGSISDAELYTYSVVWLAFGLALLFFGTLRGSQMLRFASLAVMLATVSKVFLIDAGNLTGLYRVFSFLGLGLSLLGLSYFYSRFVFGAPPPEAEEPPAPAG